MSDDLIQSDSGVFSFDSNMLSYFVPEKQFS